MSETKSLSKEVTQSKTITGALFVLIIGILMWVFGNQLIQELGSFLIGSVAIALVWELYVKRSFFEEIFAAVGISRNLQEAGISQFELDYKEFDWKDFFNGATEIDVFFSYAESWRRNYVQQVDAFANRNDVTIRVLLPNPENEETVRQLAWRFETTDEEIRVKIDQAIAYFRGKFAVGSEIKNRLDLRLTDKAPLYAFYRFDRIAVITFFNHLGRTGQIPSFTVTKGGDFYKFAAEEFEAIFQESKVLDGT